MVPPVKPVRFSVTGAADAPAARGVCAAPVVVVGDASDDDRPHVNVMELERPFEVPVPFNVAVVS